MLSIDDLKNFCKLHKDEEFTGIGGASVYSLWNFEEIEELNKGYEVEKFIPGFIAFGTDGGGKMLAVKKGTGEVYSVPFIPMEEKSADKLAENLDEFLKLKKV